MRRFLFLTWIFEELERSQCQNYNGRRTSIFLLKFLQPYLLPLLQNLSNAQCWNFDNPNAIRFWNPLFTFFSIQFTTHQCRKNKLKFWWRQKMVPNLWASRPPSMKYSGALKSALQNPFNPNHTHLLLEMESDLAYEKFRNEKLKLENSSKQN